MRAPRLYPDPATVARWHRRGLPEWWSARSRRRPGRPRIESDGRNLIRRLRTETCLWGAPRIHGEWLKLGIAVSERTVSRYRPDRTRGRSQTWRTFLRNHVGAISCHAVGASSARPGDEDVVDTGLISRGLTPPSGTAERLQPARRLPKELPRFNACLLARGMPWPDLHHRAGTGQFRPRSPTVMCRFDWPKRVRTETPSSGCALRLGSTDSLRRFVRETCQIAIGQFGDSPCAAGSMNVPTRLTRLGCARSARPRAFLSVAGVLARHRGQPRTETEIHRVFRRQRF